MVFVKEKKKIEYKQPEPLNSTNASNITVILSKYETKDDDYFTEKTVILKVPFRDIICEVDLLLVEEGLTLMEESRKYVNDFVNKYTNQRKKNFFKANDIDSVSNANVNNANNTIDGKVVVVCEPEVNTTGNRRSTRKRKVVITDD